MCGFADQAYTCVHVLSACAVLLTRVYLRACPAGPQGPLNPVSWCAFAARATFETQGYYAGITRPANCTLSAANICCPCGRAVVFDSTWPCLLLPLRGLQRGLLCMFPCACAFFLTGNFCAHTDFLTLFCVLDTRHGCARGIEYPDRACWA
jgi:hypothetical protein